MSTLIVPELERRPWPTLGEQVCQFIETFLIHGPGDIRGQPAQIDDELRALIYRMYEVYPRGHELAGRRRFKRVGISARKGTAKTEKAAWIAACELHPDAPVRCGGWKRVGSRWDPVGVGVPDPYIPMVAYTEEQTEELGYGALYVILSEGPLVNDFDIGLKRIMRVGGDGKVEALATAPNARDGARTTFQHFDETHRFTLARLREAHRNMLANMAKRKIADPWTLETTTAPAPGENSVAEDTMRYAKAVADGRIGDAKLFFFHREASDHHDLNTEDGARAAIIEASGPSASWSDIEGILELWRDPQCDRAYWQRVWTNRLVATVEQAFDPNRWAELARPRRQPPEGALITLGFDGSKFHDATGLIGTEVATGHQFVLGIWERPFDFKGDWEVPEDQVNAAVARAFGRWKVWRLYGDPPYWDGAIDRWAGEYGDKVVIKWWTNKHKAMAYAVKSYQDAQTAGDLTHDGNPQMARHIGHARRRQLPILDEQGVPLWVITKERPDSPDKIDAAAAGVLSWEARGDAIAAGALNETEARAFAIVL